MLFMVKIVLQQILRHRQHSNGANIWHKIDSILMQMETRLELHFQAVKHEHRLDVKWSPTKQLDLSQLNDTPTHCAVNSNAGHSDRKRVQIDHKKCAQKN